MEVNGYIRNFDWKKYPLMGMVDGALVSKRGDVTLGWELTLPAAHTLLESDYEALEDLFAQATALLPGWVFIHRQDVYLRENWPEGNHTGQFLADCDADHFKGKRYMTHVQRLFLTRTSRRNALTKHGQTGLFSFLFGKRFPTAAELREFEQQAGEFVAVVTRSGLVQARRMTDEDFANVSMTGVLDTYLNLCRRSSLHYDLELGHDYMKFGDRTMYAYSVCDADAFQGSVATDVKKDTRFADSSKLSLSFGSAIGLSLDCEHIVNHYILKVPQGYYVSELDTRRRRMFNFSSRSAENRVNATEAGRFIDDVHAKGIIGVYAHVNILAWDSEGSADALDRKVTTALSLMNIEGKKAIFDTPVLWYAGIPGAASELSKENLMGMELKSALCLANYESFDRDMEPEEDGGVMLEGVLQTVDRLRGIPITIDTQELAAKKGYSGNSNMFVLGPSGSGKSFFMNNYVYGLYCRGEQVFIIDKGGSYQGTAAVIREQSGGKDGVYYAWDAKHPIQFNPFEGYEDWVAPNGTLREDCSGALFLLSFLMMSWQATGGWNESEKNCVKQTVADFVSHWTSGAGNGGCPVFDDYHAFLADTVIPALREGHYKVMTDEYKLKDFDCESFRKAVSKYSKAGPFSFLLNNPEPKDLFSSRFTVFEIDELSNIKDLYPIVILCIINSFDSMMRRKNGVYKNLVIEEAWTAIKDDQFEEYLKSLWRTARKFSTSACVVTQQADDIVDSAVIKNAILDNSDVKVLLDQAKNRSSFGRLMNLLTLDELDSNLIKSIDGVSTVKEFFIKIGSAFRGVYRNEVSRQKAIAFESKFEKKKEFVRLSENFEKPVEAICKITGIECPQKTILCENQE